MNQHDTSSVYDSRNLEPEYAEGFALTLPWVFETEEGQDVFATEDEACAAQRAYRAAHGFDPLTGVKP